VSQDKATYEAFQVTTESGVSEVVLAGQGKGNPMGPAFFRELPLLFSALEKDESVRAVIVRGDGGVFTYGLDLKRMASELGPHLAGNLARERTKLLDLIGELQRGFDLVAKCRKPVIAAVCGPCIGGGVDLIAACDVRLATKDARFSVRETKVAIVADLGSLQRLPPIIGHGHTREMALTGKDVDAARALRIGLVNDVYEDEAALLAAARTMAKEIAQNPPIVVQGVKQIMNQQIDRQIAEGERFTAVWNAAFLASNDLMEAMTAFMEKRPPKYSGS
jgi:enoyl-CoA hydratase